MNKTLSLTKIRKLIDTHEVKYFALKPYGLEMLLLLYDTQKNGQEISIDEVYNALVSPMPRREAFGIFLNQLEQASLIEKRVHSNKRSMKKIELSRNIVKALNSLE